MYGRPFVAVHFLVPVRQRQWQLCKVAYGAGAAKGSSDYPHATHRVLLGA